MDLCSQGTFRIIISPRQYEKGLDDDMANPARKSCLALTNSILVSLDSLSASSTRKEVSLVMACE